MTDNVPATLESVIAARIGPIIGEMIPEEALRDTVKKTVDHFMLAELPKMLQAELSKRFTEIMLNELNDAGYRELWESNRSAAGPKVKEMIKELVPEIVVAAMNAPMNAVLQQMRYQLQSLGRN